MNRVMPAAAAKLLRLKTLGILLFVLRCRVVPLFAIRTLQRNDVAHDSIFGILRRIPNSL